MKLTILAELVASQNDGFGYITYVFKCLDKEVQQQSPYCMCVRYPNWQCRSLEIGEIGFVTVMEVKAGIDTWYDGEKQIPYKYDNIQFIKFVELPKKKDNKNYVI